MRAGQPDRDTGQSHLSSQLLSRGLHDHRAQLRFGQEGLYGDECRPRTENGDEGDHGGELEPKSRAGHALILSFCYDKRMRDDRPNFGEVLRRLRATPGPNRHIPAIALTADVTSGGRKHYLDQGFTDYSAKPIQLTDLLGAMARALDTPPPEAIKDVA